MYKYIILGVGLLTLFSTNAMAKFEYKCEYNPEKEKLSLVHIYKDKDEENFEMQCKFYDRQDKPPQKIGKECSWKNKGQPGNFCNPEIDQDKCTVSCEEK